MTFFHDYFAILMMIGVSCFIASLMIVLPFIAKKRKPYNAKNSPYECGFEPFSSSHDTRFNVRFYIIAALFIIFDLEIAFMIPWAITLKKMELLGFISMILFISMIVFGLAYEWAKGALDNR